jgi:hypothetical protein
MIHIDIVTNVSINDGIRIFYSLPNWVRIFNSRINKIIIIVDERPVEGRIGKLHVKSYAKFEINKVLKELAKKYSFVKVQKLDYSKLKEVSSRFFRTARPIRCQGGTPIFAFLAAITFASDGIILKTDCDMLFYDNGWVAKAINLLNNNYYDIIEPPKLGLSDIDFSTRAFLIDKRRFLQKMPMKAHTLGLLQIVDRKLNNRSIYLALEQMIQKEIEAGKFSSICLKDKLGYSMHIVSNNDINPESYDDVVYKVENNLIPFEQKKFWDFNKEFWQELDAN